MLSAIRYIAGKGSKGGRGHFQLLCHVKPGVDARRAGIVAVTDEHIEVCVAAQARDGEANKAVTGVIAEVRSSSKSLVLTSSLSCASTSHSQVRHQYNERTGKQGEDHPGSQHSR